MNNFQLYKTSVLLGGQLKWDIILDISDNDIYISDFHLTPISKTVPYNRYSHDDILLNKHIENLRIYYSNVKGEFYSNHIASNLDHNWPLMSGEKNYDDTFYMGCKRSEYNIYNKQFEFLCPLWLEQLSDDDKLAFEINVLNPSKDPANNYKGNKLASRTIVFETKNQKYHNKFVDYFNEYIKYIDINPGSDDVININLFNRTVKMKGIDMTSGNKVIRDVNDLADDLLSKELTLLDFNSKITSLYMNNNSIVPNLFNFNLCFNIEDIFTKGLSIKMYGKPVIIEVRAKIINGDNVTYLENRDFYTNFEYVPKKYCGDFWGMSGSEVTKPYTPLSPNVLDYLYDYKYVKDIDKAKIVQKVPYWQLYDNDEYIFNLYDGFRGFFDETVGIVSNGVYTSEQPINKNIWYVADEMGDVNGSILNLYERTHLLECYKRYADTPDISQSKYSKSLNNMGWANYVNMDYNTYISIISYYTVAVEEGLIIELKKGWNKNLYYDCGDDKVKVILGYIPDDSSFAKIYNVINRKNTVLYPSEYEQVSPDTIISVTGVDDDVVIICSRDKDKLTFAGVKKVLSEVYDYYSKLTSEDEFDDKIGTVVFNTYISRLKVTGSTWNIDENVGGVEISYGIVEGETLNLLSEVLPGSSAVNIINKLLNILYSVRPLSMVVLNASQSYMLAKSPSLSSTEIEYYIDNTSKIDLLRYDGKIKPNMVAGNKNYIYTKKFIPDVKSVFKRYKKSKYEPLFPSINYWSYESHELDYDKTPDFVKIYPEYKWFNNGLVYYTKPLLKFTIYSEFNDQESITQCIYDYLSKFFDLTNIETVKYIYNIYKIDYNLINYDNKYEYEIQMKFK